jgi:hypothetical protein
MSSGSSHVLMPPSSRATPVGLRRKFYLGLAVLLAVMIAIGFWPSYYGPLVRGAVEAPLILHVHGVIFVGWMLLLIAQTTLAARGQIRVHRALGTFGIGYGALVWAVGILVSFVAPALHVTAGEWTVDEAAAFLPIPLGDMVLFGGFLLTAAVYRSRPEVHKRLMVLATIAIVFAAAFRLQGAGVAQPLAIAIWFVPLVLAMVYDVRTRGRVHTVYWIGAVAMAVGLLRLPFGTTEAWLALGRPIIEALT